MDWMILPYRRYFDFSGRSRRKEYWMFTLFMLIIAFGIFLIGGLFSGSAIEAGETSATAGIAFILFAIFICLSVIPSIAVTVRRLHDQDRSGWWWWIQFIPFGSLVLLVFMCLDGTPGQNRFGPDPQNRTDTNVFA